MIMNLNILINNILKLIIDFIIKEWKYVFIFLSLLSCLVYLSVLHEDKTIEQPKKNKDTLIFAHRGHHKIQKENTLKSIKVAEDLGYYGVDIDINKTKDGKIIAYHDKKIKIFETYKDIRGLTYEEIIKNSSENNIDYLEDIIKNSNIIIIAEMKSDNIHKDVADTIKKLNAYNRVYVSSFNPIDIYNIKKYDSKIKTIYIFGEKGYTSKDIASNIYLEKIKLLMPHWLFINLVINIAKPNQLNVRYNLNAEYIKKLIKNNYQVLIWTPNTRNDINKSISLSPYGIVSDDPDLVRNLLHEKIQK